MLVIFFFKIYTCVFLSIFFIVTAIVDDKLLLLPSTLAPATGENATCSPPSSTFENEPTRKSHRAVSKTEKVRQLQEEKIEKNAMDAAEKEKIAKKAEKKKKKKAERSELAFQILHNVTTSRSSNNQHQAPFVADNLDLHLKLTKISC
jgi:hypothetical protein